MFEIVCLFVSVSFLFVCLSVSTRGKFEGMFCCSRSLPRLFVCLFACLSDVFIVHCFFIDMLTVIAWAFGLLFFFALF